MSSSSESESEEAEAPAGRRRLLAQRSAARRKKFLEAAQLAAGDGSSLLEDSAVTAGVKKAYERHLGPSDAGQDHHEEEGDDEE